MRHIRRLSAALAVASAAFVLAAPATAASAAGSSSSPTIEVTNGQFNLLAPNARVGNSTKALAATGAVTAAHAFSTFQTVTVQSKGFDITGRITGRIHGYNYQAIYQVYNLPRTAKWDLWGISFKADKSQSVLRKTVEDATQTDFDLDIRFSIKAADLQGVSSLRIGFETLRLVQDGQIKDFTVVNTNSGGAMDQGGNQIPVNFQPI